MFYLYEILFPNGKKYIGCTDNLHRRWDEHIKCALNWSPFPVHCAMRHFTADGTTGGIKLGLIGKTETQEDILYWEAHEIDRQNTLCPNGYNLAVGGHGGSMRNPEVAAKVSATKKAMGCTPRMRAAADRNRGTKRTPEQIKALSLAHMGKPWSEKHRAATATPEYQALRSAISREVANRPHVKAALRASNIGRILSPETLARMGAASRASAFTPARVAQLAAARANHKPGYFSSEEGRAKLRAAWAERKAVALETGESASSVSVRGRGKRRIL